jgi:hypothetical protein
MTTGFCRRARGSHGTMYPCLIMGRNCRRDECAWSAPIGQVFRH